MIKIDKTEFAKQSMIERHILSLITEYELITHDEGTAIIMHTNEDYAYQLETGRGHVNLYDWVCDQIDGDHSDGIYFIDYEMTNEELQSFVQEYAIENLIDWEFKEK